MRTVLFYAREFALGLVGLAGVLLAVVGAFVLPAVLWIGLMVVFLLAVIAVRVSRPRERD